MVEAVIFLALANSMASIGNAIYGVTSKFMSVPGLLYRIREQLETILTALNTAVPLNDAQFELHASIREKYLNYEEQFEQFNAASGQEETEQFLGRVSKFRNDILTQSKKLKLKMPMSSYLFNTTTPLRAPTQPAPQQQYAQPSALGQQIAAPVAQPSVPLRGGGPGAPAHLARPAHMQHQPRRSQSMPFNMIVEESDIRPTPLTMPPRKANTGSARFNQYNPPAVSPSFGGAAHPSHGAALHNRQISVASTQTFGHGAPPPPPASRPSVESDQSFGSSTGDVSVTVHTGASYRAPASVPPPPATLVTWFRSQYPEKTDDEISRMVQAHWEQRIVQQQRQGAQAGQPRLR